MNHGGWYRLAESVMAALEHPLRLLKQVGRLISSMPRIYACTRVRAHTLCHPNVYWALDSCHILEKDMV